MTRRLAALIGAALVVLGLAAGAALSAGPLSRSAVATPTAAVFPTSAPPRATIALPTPPARDLYAIAERLRTKGTPIPRTIDRPQEQVGDERTFWVMDISTARHFPMTATLRHATARLALFLQNGLHYSEADLQRSAEIFETTISPCVRGLFGSEWSPGVDNDPRLTILIGNIPGVAGYYSSADQYPTAVNPFSNEREMFYLNAGAIRLGSPQFLGTMAHEFFHMVQWANDPAEETWVNEGLAELSAEFCGTGASFVNAFLANPNTQLTSWASNPSAAAPNYGAAYLFMRYLAERFGRDTLADLVREPERGIAGVEAWLARRGGPTFDEVFKEWTVANLLNLRGHPRYGYEGLRQGVTPRLTLSQFGSERATVRQYAAQYVELRLPGDATIRFEGSTTVKLVSAEPRSGRSFWWSNRGDSINPTLTRAVDLRGARSATLEFAAWYDLERDWDFAYVMVSTDGGRTWDILPGRTAVTNPGSGFAFGPGWTGMSGGQRPEWVEERVDLTPYAGKQILLRFEVITDDAVNHEGFAIDDLRIPEIGWSDDAEDERDWQANGFVLLRGEAPQRFQVQLVRFGSETTVEDLPLDAHNRGEVTIRAAGGAVPRAVLIVSAVTPVTTHEAAFRVTAEPAR
ncbi:MAG: immune inhibitor A [Chloroflexota bacterium]|nr:immune inhibitor A [Dehalococcoidia bacterium]MDW8255144.1 immune inhibitor A [Chloroflexota bacterium]